MVTWSIMMGKDGTINRFTYITGSENCIPSLYGLFAARFSIPCRIIQLLETLGASMIKQIFNLGLAVVVLVLAFTAAFPMRASAATGSITESITAKELVLVRQAT